MSQSEPTDGRARRIRGKIGRFRILVIGRANAGKTTILQKVCNTTEQPVIHTASGETIETSVIAPSAMRGLHDIENEMVFESNPKFIFHDSRGFEAGGTAELDSVKAFIARRAKAKKVHEQVHAIWYCIPMDDSRPFTRAEISFFSECGTGSVPVVAIFTKFDALDDKAFDDLERAGFSFADAKKQAPFRAVADFDKVHLGRLYERQYPPKGHVYLRDMNMADVDCNGLIEKTASVLDDNNLQLLFVSSQQNNLELCIGSAVKRTLMAEIIKTDPLTDDFSIKILGWFPQFWHFLLLLDDVDDLADAADDFVDDLDADAVDWIPISSLKSSTLQSSLHAFTGPPPTDQQKARLGLTLAIIGEYSFFLWDRDKSLWKTCVAAAVDCYKQSPSPNAVVHGVDALFRHKTFQTDSEKHTFAQELVQIALDNRLSKGPESNPVQHSVLDVQSSNQSNLKPLHITSNTQLSASRSASRLADITPDNPSLEGSPRKRDKLRAAILRPFKAFKLSRK